MKTAQATVVLPADAAQQAAAVAVAMVVAVGVAQASPVKASRLTATTVAAMVDAHPPSALLHRVAVVAPSAVPAGVLVAVTMLVIKATVAMAVAVAAVTTSNPATFATMQAAM